MILQTDYSQKINYNSQTSPKTLEKSHLLKAFNLENIKKLPQTFKTQS